MRRREFIGGLGSVAAWPIVAHGQQPAMPVVGLLFGGSPRPFRVAALRQGIEVGYVEGQNVALEYRWAENQYDRLPSLAAELVGRRVTVLIVVGNAATNSVKALTASIPIVFETGYDPIERDLVGSLARPDRNLTGVTFLGGEMSPKLFVLLHEAVPRAAIIGLLENPTNPNADAIRRSVEMTPAASARHFRVGQDVDLIGGCRRTPTFDPLIKSQRTHPLETGTLLTPLAGCRIGSS